MAEGEKDRDHRDNIQNGRRIDELRQRIDDLRRDLRPSNTNLKRAVFVGIVAVVLWLGYVGYSDVVKRQEEIILRQNHIINYLRTDIIRKMEEMEKNVKSQVGEMRTSFEKEIRDIKEPLKASFNNVTSCGMKSMGSC